MLLKIFKQIALDNCRLIASKPISKQFIQFGIDNLYAAIQYVNDLHYAPPSDKFNWHLVLTEKCGTCSTKHALLVELGKEIGVPFALGSGIYKMSSENFPILQNILSTSGLAYIPESHNFIVYNNFWLDITFRNAAQILDEDDIDQMQIINIDDLIKIKTQTYPKFLQQWLLENKPDMDLNQYGVLHQKIVEALGREYS